MKGIQKMLFESKDKKFLRTQQKWCASEQERITDNLALIDRLERDGRADADILARKEQLLADQDNLCQLIAENTSIEMALRGPVRLANRHRNLTYIFLLIAVAIACKMLISDAKFDTKQAVYTLLAMACTGKSFIHASKNAKYSHEAADILNEIHQNMR